MKRKGSRKSKIFNSINVILIALLFVELILVGNWIATGNPVRGIVSETEPINLESTTSNSLGNLVTKEGTVELIIADNFENPKLSKELYYLNENGKRYLLSTDKPLPVSAKIKVTGYLKDDTLSFASSSTKDANLQGTSYSVTSTTIEPWSPTLGEQKYAVVFLFRGNETQFNVETLTNTTFGLANSYINETSYGKASVSYGYVGAFILNESFFNGSLCDTSGHGGFILGYAVQKADPFVNFSEYDGIIVYHPNTPCTSYYAGWTWSFKGDQQTQEGIVKLYQTLMNGGYLHDNTDPYAIYVLTHEMGHQFGMGHATLLTCYLNDTRTTLSKDCFIGEYGDIHDIMGSGLYKHQGLKHKTVFTNWVNASNILEVTEGTYLISPLSTNLETNKLKGLKIPIFWNTSQITIKYSPSFNNTFDNEGSTHYYLEYRTPQGFDVFSTPINGILLRLGRNDPYWYDDAGTPAGYWPGNTYLLNLHPNSFIGNCSEACAYNYFYLEENQTYFDSFNKMNITILDMNESGALVKITRLQTCTDTDGGKIYNTKGTVTTTNLTGPSTYQDVCTTQNNLKEYYCQNNQANYTYYYCTYGCSLGKCKPNPNPPTGCYTDPKTKKKVCPGTPVA